MIIDRKSFYLCLFARLSCPATPLSTQDVLRDPEHFLAQSVTKFNLRRRNPFFVNVLRGITNDKRQRRQDAAAAAREKTTKEKTFDTYRDFYLNGGWERAFLKLGGEARLKWIHRYLDLDLVKEWGYSPFQQDQQNQQDHRSSPLDDAATALPTTGPKDRASSSGLLSLRRSPSLSLSLSSSSSASVEIVAATAQAAFALTSSGVRAAGEEEDKRGAGVETKEEEQEGKNFDCNDPALRREHRRKCEKRQRRKERREGSGHQGEGGEGIDSAAGKQ
jgi:hypothetical protein